MRVGTEPVSTWEQLRAAVMRQTEPVDIEIERGGTKQVLRVTPRQGRIGVSVQMAPQKLTVWAALARAIPLPSLVVTSAAKSFLAIATEKEAVQLGGPDRMIVETGTAGLSGMFWFLAALASYFSPILSGVVVFELATHVVFRVTHPESTTSDARGFRLARIEQSLVLSSIASLLSVPAYLLARSGAPVALVLLLWLMPASVALYPLIAIGGRELWSRSAVVGYVAASLVMPCFLPPFTTMLLFALKRAIRAEGFRFGWFRSEPPAAVTP